MITIYKDFKEKLDAWLWKRERLGIEIDGRVTRIVRLGKSVAGNYTVAAYGEIDVDLLHANDLEKQKLRIAVRQLGEGIRVAAINIDHPSLRIRKMSFAKMPDNDLIEAIKWNFREHVEGPIEKYLVSYSPLEGSKDQERMSVVSYGVSSEAVDEHAKFLKSLGLKPISVEPTATALLAAMSANGILSDDKKHVCVFFGSSTTLFSVMEGSSMLFCRPLPGISNEALLKLIMRNLNISAEKAKWAIDSWVKGTPPVASEDQELMKRIETSTGHFFSQMVIEMQRSIDAFCIMYSVERVDSMHLCGLGVFYPGLVDHVKKSLGIETQIFNPFKGLLPQSRLSEDVNRIAPLYAVGVGLAIP